MTALKITGVVALLLLLVLLLRVGVTAELGEEPSVRLRVGPFRRTLVPKKEKKPKESESSAEAAKPKRPKAAKKSLPKPTRTELRSLVRTAIHALSGTARKVCRRVRIAPLEVCVTFAGSDPAETAQNYGYANAALWSVMPRLEEIFNIPAPSVTLRTDFEGERTRVEGTVGVSLRICDLLAIVFTLVFPLGKWFLVFKKAHKNDPPRETETAEGGNKDESKTEKLTA